ncbi:putative F-box protein PP2-B12 [Telopea speciosissima]|uniref:putative F-box protein PP2-B12 n=1 Tax=Telopea speciosissima TaxID=54955 RepID=UPI001CC7746E|nr:putative F-box protein PP2-B12 [Telopea speciosissima]
MEQGSTFDLYNLPKDCFWNILYVILTSPRDACRLSFVSTVFRSVADSDLVWERFFPPDIQQILSSSVSPFPATYSSKKELFLHVCNNPFLIDRGTKTFALEKCSGKKCYMIGARELCIIWSNTPRYWTWRPLPESRFSEVAELLEVCWLEIICRMETRLLSPNTTYGAYLVFMFTERAYGFVNQLVEVSVKLAGGGNEEGEVTTKRKSVYLDPEERQREQEGQVPKERGDGHWMEIEMGEFFINEISGGEDGVVEMILKEVKDLNWKSGLIIQGIELRPKEN